MKGQWIGQYTGSSSGIIIVNVDELSTCYAGVAYLHESNPTLPTTAVFFRTHNKSSPFAFQPHKIAPVDTNSGLVTTWEHIRHLYPNVSLSRQAAVTGTFTTN